MIQLSDFLSSGLTLISIPPDKAGRPTKGPSFIGWNKPASQDNPGGYSKTIRRGAGYNYGLLHSESHTIAIDFDDLAKCRELFSDLCGIDIDALLSDPDNFCVKSPKANRGKLIFRLPDGVELKTVHKHTVGKDTIFELRAGPNQDVIFGQHPEGGFYEASGDPANIPLCPGAILNMAQNWGDWKKVLNPPAEPKKISRVNGGSDAKRDFNYVHTVFDVLERNGYVRIGSRRFLRPGSSTGIPGVVLHDDGTIFSFGGDDLADGHSHDAFEAYRILECGGDFKKAIRWNSEVKAKRTTQESEQTNFDGGFFAPSLMGKNVRDGTTTTRPLTELGNAERFRDKHNGNIKYIPESKGFIRWINGAWAKDDDGAVVREMFGRLAMDVYEEGSRMLDDGVEFAKWARKSQDRHTITAATELFKDFSTVRVKLSVLDSNIMQAGINNAREVIDLVTGQCRKAMQTDLVTKSLNVDYLGDQKKAVLWVKFLSDIFGENEQLIAWVKRWCGYLLTGDISEHVFLFCFGCGSNGKSVFAEVLHHILGDYSRSISAETLTVSNKGGSDATPDIAALSGVRLGLSTETKDGSVFNESRLKGLVSGDPMPARFLNKEFFDLVPILKLMILGNHKPTIKGSDDGIWRRVLLLPFERTFQGESKDKNLKSKLIAEAPHILAWIVSGAVEWNRDGLSDIPTVIKSATEAYRLDQDIIGAWLSENCILDDDARIKKSGWDIESESKLLYSNYKDWCFECGMKAASKNGWTRRMAERGLQKRILHNKDIYGVKIIERF